MAFRFGDPGGKIYSAVGASNANLLAHWTSIGGSGNWAVSAGNGRHDGGSSLRSVSVGNASDGRLFKTLDARATWGIAFGFRIASMIGGGNTQIAGVRDGTTAQWELRLNADGTLVLTRNGTQVGSASTAALSANVYYHVEVKVTVGAAGAYEVRLNRAAVIGPATGNTQNTANATASQVFIGPFSSGGGSVGAIDYDDVIVWDTQATDANGFSDIHDWVGDKGLYWQLPTGAGTTTQWTPDTGSNYARVNEATPDGDTSYVSSSTVGEIDTYAMADLPAHVANVVALATVHYARKDDVGSRGMKSELRSAGANAAHATELALANGYLYYFQSWGQDPNAGTPAAWTVAAVNALELGQNLSS